MLKQKDLHARLDIKPNSANYQKWNRLKCFEWFTELIQLALIGLACERQQNED